MPTSEPVNPLPRLRELVQQMPAPPDFDESDPASAPAYRALLAMDLEAELEANAADFAKLFAKKPVPSSTRALAILFTGTGPKFIFAAAAYPDVPMLALNEIADDEEGDDEPDLVVFDKPRMHSALLAGIYACFAGADDVAYRQRVLRHLCEAMVACGTHVAPWLVARHRKTLLAKRPSLLVLLMFAGDSETHLLGRLTRESWEPADAVLEAAGADPDDNPPLPDPAAMAEALYPQFHGARAGTKPLDGSDPLPALLELQRRVPAPPDFDESDPDSYPEYRFLRDRDMAQDLREYAEAFEAVFADGGPPDSARAIVFWVIGSGPDYPLGVSAVDDMPLPLTDRVLDDLEGDTVWEVTEADIISGFLQGLDAYADAVDGEDFAEDLRDFVDEAVAAHGEAVFPWLVLRHRERLLGNAEERYFVYGFHGSGEPQVMGRLTRDAWETVDDLLEEE